MTDKERIAVLEEALREMRDRDDRNGSLPPWYRSRIDAVLSSPGISQNTLLKEALGWFLNDSRFVVSVGGNPNVVDRMLTEARRRALTPEGE